MHIAKLTPPLSKQEESRLIKMAQQGSPKNIEALRAAGKCNRSIGQTKKAAKQAMDKLVLANTKWIIKFCTRMYERDKLVPVEDMVQVGVIGLMKAIYKFDTSRNTRLLTYAGYFVLQAMQGARPDYMNARLIGVTKARMPGYKDGAIKMTDYSNDSVPGDVDKESYIAGPSREPRPDEAAEEADEQSSRSKKIDKIRHWLKNATTKREQDIFYRRAAYEDSFVEIAKDDTISKSRAAQIYEETLSRVREEAQRMEA